MATEEIKKENQAQGLELQERQRIDNPAELLQKSINGSLSQLGGFQMLKGFIKGVENMDPKRKAAQNIFLTDEVYKEDRTKLKNELAMWISILEGRETQTSVLVESCEQQRSKAEQNLSENLKKIHKEIQRQEVTYRTLDAFFANASQGEVNCLTLMNVDKENLKTNDSDDTLAVRKELKKYYDKLVLKQNYSLLVIPGYLGSADTVRMWAKTAYNNRVIMVTDFMDSLDYKTLQKKIQGASLQGQEKELAQVVMTCNYLLGRKKSELAEEDDDVFIPGSGALAGRMADTDSIVISQGAAGMKYGTLYNVKGARMELSKEEFSALIDLGVVPMVEEDGRTMAFSNRSLYNGGVIGLQEYPIVRVFDWIGKVFQNFFNEQAFTNWNPAVRDDLKQAVRYFLSDYKGPGKLIENYDVKKIDQNPISKDIEIEVELKPFYAAKDFFITLKGHERPGGADWDQDVK